MAPVRARAGFRRPWPKAHVLLEEEVRQLRLVRRAQQRVEGREQLARRLGARHRTLVALLDLQA
jgi:hypothetical protein